MHSFFRGTSHDQDSRFQNKNKKLKESMKFPSVYRLKVDMKKVSLDVMKPWMAQRISELLEMEDDVVVGLAVNILEEWVQKGNSDPRDLQIQLQGFLASKSSVFVGELWKLLASASESPGGIPAELLAQYQTRNKPAEEVKVSPPPPPPSAPARVERPPSPAHQTHPGKHVENGDDQRRPGAHDSSGQRLGRGRRRNRHHSRSRSRSRGNVRRRRSHRSRSRSASRSRSSSRRRQSRRRRSQRRSRSPRSRSRTRRVRLRRQRSRSRGSRSQRSQSRRSRSRGSRSRRSRSRGPQSRKSQSRRSRSRSRSRSSGRQRRHSQRQHSSRATSSRSRSRSDSRARRRRRRRGIRSRSPSEKSSANASDASATQQADDAKRLAERELREKALRSVVVNATKKKLGEKGGRGDGDKSA